MVAATRPQIEFRGLARRRRVTAAVVALQGASRAELSRAVRLARSSADRSLLVAVDGGLKTCRAARRTPDLFVGDVDSCSGAPRNVPSIVFPQDKDYSDLSGALREIAARKIDLVVVAGLVGGRLDHEWANLQEVGRQAPAFAGVVAPTDRGTVLVTSRGATIGTEPGRTFSVFPLGSMATVTLRGARWELERRRIREGSHGLSNVTGPRLVLDVHSGVVALVLVPPEEAG
jgi:thiamine pyrophosphokinase